MATASAVILAALPTGVLVFVLAQQYDIYLQRSTAGTGLDVVVDTRCAVEVFVGA